MKTLTIQDLARNDDLGRDALSAVRGGYNMGAQYRPPSFGWCPPAYAGPQSIDSSLHATQNLSQQQQVFNDTANGSAFLSGVDVTNKTKQFGQNNITFG